MRSITTAYSILKEARRNARSIAPFVYATLRRSSLPVGFCNIQNFGDQLNWDVFRFFGIDVCHAPVFSFSRAIGLGSILHMVPSNYRGTIIGSGLIKQCSRSFPRARIKLVRGRTTRALLGLSEECKLGDPGIIVSDVYREVVRSNKEWDVGIVLHYVDAAHPLAATLKINCPRLRIKFIDVRNHPRDVVHEISGCVRILSSSLHGLVVADSLGIPNRWIIISDSVIGGAFKFEDYYSSFDVCRDPVRVQSGGEIREIIDSVDTIAKSKVELIKRNVADAFRDYRLDIDAKDA